MRLRNVDDILKDISKVEETGQNSIKISHLKDYLTTDIGLVEAIPLNDFFKAISNIQLDGDDMSEFSDEYRDGYGDGTRNAIVEMVMSLYDNADKFWGKYSEWREENGSD